MIINSILGHDSASVANSLFESFFSGLTHPILGIDHLLVMIAIGVISTLLGGEYIWRVPLLFITGLVTGGALGLMGFEISSGESMIVASLLLISMTIIFSETQLLLVGVAVIVGILGLVHGNPHGLEMPAMMNPFYYIVGFVIASAAAHVLGIFGASTAERMMSTSKSRIVIGSFMFLGSLGVAFGVV